MRAVYKRHTVEKVRMYRKLALNVHDLDFSAVISDCHTLDVRVFELNMQSYNKTHKLPIDRA